MLKPKVVLLIFVSGKIVLTGAKVSLYIPRLCILVDVLARSARRSIPRSMSSILCSGSTKNHNSTGMERTYLKIFAVLDGFRCHDSVPPSPPPASRRLYHIISGISINVSLVSPASSYLSSIATLPTYNLYISWGRRGSQSHSLACNRHFLMARRLNDVIVFSSIHWS